MFSKTIQPDSPKSSNRTGLRRLGLTVRFDRNEWSGAFGDIGTDLPLIAGMILAAQLHPASVLIVFGAMQVATALLYGIPMPVQPLKAVAALVIADKLSAGTIYGAGLAIGLLMLLLTVTGLVDWLTRVIPKAVVRGIQFGLGVKLALLALQTYVPSDGGRGYVLAAGCLGLALLTLGNRRWPPALFVIGLGLLYAAVFHRPIEGHPPLAWAWPRLFAPTTAEVWQGFLVLALAQIPLSLGNSILATRQIAHDLFPEKRLSTRKISFTYSIMNLIAPFVSGVPVCHGSGGMAGHYAFGGRTGGSVVIYGAFYLALGLLFSGGFEDLLRMFPLPVLGVILLIEGVTMMRFIGDLAADRSSLALALLVGLLCAGLPYGFAIGMLVGVLVAWLSARWPIEWH